ncbi:ArsR/SmtB family transcription factor [Alkaliphilus peptidifermentans]|uniref:Transcriptional regulator, ArsR family n=1 Tax=Alkaliphilus peptidifermentans DSM 18978 TaxID=1120976 RepID=A0A1G5AKL3_9FIRM|nr:metalloregulator ArsR/SmtB family transcription factor [Alkaliphilus peptidifermentans]SCX78427.1 transcriptional regulator, ArsR family [Alkaliphilus peptidifermentans DSM 18978]
MLVDIFKAIGDETRIRIINLLIKEELCVCEIEAILKVSQSNASRHLNKLKGAGIITCVKKAQWVYYQIDNSFIDENKLLYEYIQTQLQKTSIYLKDAEELTKFRSSNMTCVILKEEFR